MNEWTDHITKGIKSSKIRLTEPQSCATRERFEFSVEAYVRSWQTVNFHFHSDLLSSCLFAGILTEQEMNNNNPRNKILIK